MSGPKQELAFNQQIAQNQLGMSNEAAAASEADRAARDKALQPSLDLFSAIQSGDLSKSIPAAMPMLAPIYQSYPAAKEAIFRSTAPGAARDVALGDLETSKAGAVASTLSNLAAQSYDKQANIGMGLGTFSLQDLGAALRGSEGAAQTNQANIQAKMQQKSDMMRMFGSIISGAGSAATHIFGGGGGGGGKSTAGTANSLPGGGSPYWWGSGSSGMEALQGLY